MSIKYIPAAILRAEHGNDCFCLHCQTALERLSMEVSSETKIVAYLSTLTILRHQEEEAIYLKNQCDRWEARSTMSDIKYQSYSRNRDRPPDD